MTTGVYFDLDGTLLEYTASFDEILTRTLPIEATERIVDTYTERILTALAEFEDDPYRRAFASVCDECGLDDVLDAVVVSNEVVRGNRSPRSSRRPGSDSPPTRTST